MTIYNQLSNEQRDIIQTLINQKKSFSYISKVIDKDRTTISKEIRRNRYIKSNFYDAFDEKGIQQAISKCSNLSKPCLLYTSRCVSETGIDITSRTHFINITLRISPTWTI